MRAKKMKTVLCVRNPKDATVSLFNHLKNGIRLNYEGKNFDDFVPFFFTKHGKKFSQAGFDKPLKNGLNGFFNYVCIGRFFQPCYLRNDKCQLPNAKL